MGSLEDLRKSMRASGRLNSSGDPSPPAAGMEFSSDAGRRGTFCRHSWVLGNRTKTRAHEWLAAGKIDAVLTSKAEQYANRRPRVNGLFAGAPEAIGEYDVLELPLRARNESGLPEHQPRLGPQLRGLGGWRMGLLFRGAAQQP